MNMPKRKDPDIPVRIGLAICPWPGIASDKVEQLVTRKIEQAATGNSKVERVESTTQDNISVVQVRLLDSIKNTDQEFQDIGQRLKQIETTFRTAPARSPGSATSATRPRSC